MKDAGCSSRKQWKERIARRFRSHARIDSVCPYCKHVVCTQGCKDMQRQKDALLSWFYTCKDRKRSVSPSDNSASSDNANEFNMSEDDGYMSGEGGREGGRDPEMTAPGCSRAPSDHSDNDFARVVFERASRNSPLMISESVRWECDLGLKSHIVCRGRLSLTASRHATCRRTAQTQLLSSSLDLKVATSSELCRCCPRCLDRSCSACCCRQETSVTISTFARTITPMLTPNGSTFKSGTLEQVSELSVEHRQPRKASILVRKVTSLLGGKDDNLRSGSGLQPLLYSSMKQQAHNVGSGCCHVVLPSHQPAGRVASMREEYLVQDESDRDRAKRGARGELEGEG
eukprot:766603-Hanusia_phi.AAC.3